MHRLQSNPKKHVRSFVTIQCLIGFILSLLITLFTDTRYGVSAILGVLAACIPNMVFAATFFRVSGANAAKQILRRFYMAEALKYLLTVAFFGWIFQRTGIYPGVVLFTYIFLLITNWFSPIWIKQHTRASDV